MATTNCVGPTAPWVSGGNAFESARVGPAKFNGDVNAARVPARCGALCRSGTASGLGLRVEAPRRKGSTRRGGACADARTIAAELTRTGLLAATLVPCRPAPDAGAAITATIAIVRSATRTPIRWPAFMRVTVHRIPFSTNVERIALAAGYKGITVDWVDHDPADRSAIRALSGQDFVPVAELDGRVIVDSPVILRELERLVPEPALWPADRARRAEADVFVDWFNRVWKVAPNRIADEPDAPGQDAWAAELRGSLDRFEALLDGRDFLLSDTLGVADVVAFPFLKYAASIQPDDPDRFHHVLAEHLALGDGFDRLRGWIARCDALPRA